MSIRESNHIRPRRGKPVLWTQSASARRHFAAETLGEMALASTNFGLGFKNFRNAAITISGVELMHRIRKGQFRLGSLGVQGGAAPAAWNAVLGA